MTLFLTKLFVWAVFLLTSPIWIPLTLFIAFLEIMHKVWWGSLWLFEASIATVYWSIDTVRGATELSLSDYIKENIE